MINLIKVIAACTIAQQMCGNYLILINQSTNSIQECNTVTLKCNEISWVNLFLIRNTNSCSKLRVVDKYSGEFCQ